MLLDSAAELILHRAVQSKLAFHQMESQLLSMYDRSEKLGLVLGDAEEQQRADLRRKVLSKSKLRDLDRNFDSKAEYLTSLGDLPQAETRVLRKLHAYRNEAYHRDTVRPGSLRSAVSIYSYLACTMMRDLNVTGIAVSLNIPSALKPYLDQTSLSAMFEAPEQVASKLLAASGMDQQEDLGIALGNHLDDRLQAMLEGLNEIVGFIFHGSFSEPWDVETALVLIQVDDQTGAFMTPEEARRTRVPFTLDDVGVLRGRAQALAHEIDPVRAFAEFADIEDAFEAVEGDLGRALIAIDDEIQLQIDIARGK